MRAPSTYLATYLAGVTVVLAIAVSPLATEAQEVGLSPTLAAIKKSKTVRLGYREASPPS